MNVREKECQEVTKDLKNHVSKGASIVGIIWLVYKGAWLL